MSDFERNKEAKQAFQREEKEQNLGSLETHFCCYLFCFMITTRKWLTLVKISLNVREQN